MADQDTVAAAEVAALAMHFVLNAHLAVTGELAAALVASGAIPADTVARAMRAAADAITAPLEASPDVRNAALINAVKEFAEQLRRMASDVSGARRSE